MRTLKGSELLLRLWRVICAMRRGFLWLMLPFPYIYFKYG